jgi:predicted kinase
MNKPLLIIVNGLPGSGKTTLANQLAQDLSLPVFSRDGLYETLFDGLRGGSQIPSDRIGSASFRVLYYGLGLVLAAGQSMIVEGFFGLPDVRTAEFVELQRRFEFEPFQILCKADGDVLLKRFLARAGSEGRHRGHGDLDWLEQNKERLLGGVLPPLSLNGQLIEVDTTTPNRFDYDSLLHQLSIALEGTQR